MRRLLKLLVLLVFVLFAVIGIIFSALGVNNHFHAKGPVRQRIALRTAGTSIQERYLEMLKLYLARYDCGGDNEASENGNAWPIVGETMIGLKRLDNLHACIKSVLQLGVPGDFIEAGAWRGGATIFMRAALLAYDDSTRRVWVADSFEGLPTPDPKRYPADTERSWPKGGFLAASLDEVKGNFTRYGLLDDRVLFLRGWFKDTLPSAPIQQLAIVRLDADMYESTMEGLQSLYGKVSPGGYIIIDDYSTIPVCKRAVDDFRAKNGIVDKIRQIDFNGVYWQRSLR
jgi:O-methyltransferase